MVGQVSARETLATAARRKLCSHYIVLGSFNNGLTFFVGLEQVFKCDQLALFSGRVNGDQYSMMRFVRG